MAIVTTEEEKELTHDLSNGAVATFYYKKKVTANSKIGETLHNDQFKNSHVL